MPYVSLDNLARFHGRLRDRASSEFASLDMANWQKTPVAGAVSFSPVPEMPLDPVVNFKFTETGPASGTKGPDNPSTITGVSSIIVRRYNKNIFGAYGSRREGQTVTVNNVDFTYYTDGSILINGTANALTQRFLNGSAVPDSIFILRKGDTYTLSGFPSGSSDYPRLFFRCNNNTYYYISSLYPTRTIAISKDEIPGIWIEITNGTTVDNLLIHPQLELGSTATVFEPSVMDVHTIPFNDTYYGGSVDLSTGIMTVTYRAFELTPSNMNVRTPNETAAGIWNTPCLQLVGSNAVNVFGYDASSGYIGTNYFCNISDWNSYGGVVSYHFSSSNFYLSVAADSASAATTYITNLIAEKYAAGTPIFAGYPLANPYTVQLTPTQIKSLPALSKYEPRTNTVYSDQESVQVGYPKSPIATDNELTNAIISLGGNV